MKKKLLLSILATSTILSACSSKNQHAEVEKIYEYLSKESNIPDLKTTKPTKATDTEIEYNIPSIKNLENSIEYSLKNNKYLKLVENNKEIGNSEYFNEEVYNEAIKNKEDIFYATVENNLNGYFKIGLINYSTDKTFNDENKLIASYPYISINPRIKISKVDLYNYNKENKALFNYSLYLDLSNLSDEEIIAINKKLNIEEEKVQKQVLLQNFLPLLNNDTAK